MFPGTFPSDERKRTGGRWSFIGVGWGHTSPSDPGTEAAMSRDGVPNEQAKADPDSGRVSGQRAGTRSSMTPTSRSIRDEVIFKICASKQPSGL